MTCMARSNPPRARRPRHAPLLAAAVLAALLAAPASRALKSDRGQPLQVHAQRFEGEQRRHIVHLYGDVTLEQGSLRGSAARATVYTDAGNKVIRVVLEGRPARLSQQLDGGGEMHGSALTIDYAPGSDTATLIGDAHVQQSGRGSFSGAKLTYNTQTGAMQGVGGRGRVQLIFQPRAKAGPARPVSASAPAGGGTR